MPDAVQLSHVAPGVVRVTLPLPFRLDHVHCYILEDDPGWTIVDTGLNTTAGRAVWQHVFEELSIAAAELRRLIITHAHPDHVGLAGWLEQWVAEDDAGRALPIYMTSAEQESFAHTWQLPADQGWGMTDYFLRAGIAPEIARRADADTAHTAARTRPHPSRFQTLSEGDAVDCGRRHFTVALASGHSAGMAMLYDARDELLLCGDQLLMKITPNIGYWPQMADEPLTGYLMSLERLRDLPVRLALPGHRQTIEDWPGRIDELMHHHRQRLEETWQAVLPDGSSIAEVATDVFRVASLNAHEARFAIAETYAHLAYLVKGGELDVVESGGVLRFSRM